MRPASFRLAFVPSLTAVAYAGTVSFEPQERVVDPAVSTRTTFEVVISETPLGTFESVDLILGSDDLQITEWEFAFFVICDFGACADPAGVYPSDLQFGWFGPPVLPPFHLGTLTVDASGLGRGTYSVIVDAQRDGGRSTLALGTNIDTLFGSATVTVIPEPATLALLAIGAVFSFHRSPRPHPQAKMRRS